MIIQDAHAVVGTDWNGIAVVIGAIGAFIVSVGNVWLNWKAKQTHDVDKKEAIQAREQQNVKLEDIHVATNSAKEKLEAAEAHLKAEIARMAQPGASPTLERPAGGEAPPAVSIDKGVVSVVDEPKKGLVG